MKILHMGYLLEEGYNTTPKVNNSGNYVYIETILRARILEAMVVATVIKLFPLSTMVKGGKNLETSIYGILPILWGLCCNMLLDSLDSLKDTTSRGWQSHDLHPHSDSKGHTPSTTPASLTFNVNIKIIGRAVEAYHCPGPVPRDSDPAVQL